MNDFPASGILVLAPHPDDAVLSVGAHMHVWLERGIPVTVLTLFTSTGGQPGKNIWDAYLPKLGFPNVDALFAVRLQEEATAMATLGVKWINAGLTDAVFRPDAAGMCPPTMREMRSHGLADRDVSLVEPVAEIIRQHAGERLIVAPAGVGGHRDHWLTRMAAERVGPGLPQAIYTDMPYGQRPWKYQIRHFADFLLARPTFLPSNERKRALLAVYATQLPFLGKGASHAPDLLWWRRRPARVSAS